MARSEAHASRDAAVRAGLNDIEANRQAPTTKDIIASECQRLETPVKVEDVPNSNGARIHWVGDTSSQNFVLYFHGGGFAFPAIPGHVIFWIQTQQRLAAKGKPFVVAILEYGLTPEHKFPSQIIQGIQAHNQILKSGRKPSDVIISGDSAGGNLALGILSASLHQHALIPKPELDEPLKGLLLISAYDILPPVGGSVDNYRAHSDNDKDPLFVPAIADSKWWMEAPVRSILNLAGTHELLFDDLESFGETLEHAGLNVQTVACEKQVHVDAMLDAVSGLQPGRMSWAIWEWLDSML